MNLWGCHGITSMRKGSIRLFLWGGGLAAGVESSHAAAVLTFAASMREAARTGLAFL
jgi:hypothetical protein